MQVVEFNFMVMNDPVLAVVAVLGLFGMVCLILGAMMRSRGGRRWDRVFLAGALLIAAAFFSSLAYSWIASPR